MRAEAGWILRWTFSCRVEGGEESSLTQRRLIDALSHHAHIAYQSVIMFQIATDAHTYRSTECM